MQLFAATAAYISHSLPSRENRKHVTKSSHCDVSPHSPHSSLPPSLSERAATKWGRLTLCYAEARTRRGKCMSSSLMATLCNFRSIVSLLFSGFVVSSSIQAPPVPAHKIRPFWSIKTACTLPRACRHLCIGVVILNGVGDKGDIHTITESEIFSEREPRLEC